MFFISSVIFYLYVTLGLAIFSILDHQPIEDFYIMAAIQVPIVACSFLSTAILDRFIKVSRGNGVLHFVKFGLIGAVGTLVLTLTIDANEAYFTDVGLTWQIQLPSFMIGALNGLFAAYITRNKDDGDSPDSLPLLRAAWTGGAVAVMLALTAVYYFGWEK